MACELTIPQQLKISCFSKGIRIDKAAEEKLSEGGEVPLTIHEYATTGGVTFALEGGVYVNAPFDEWFCADAEATLAVDDSSDDYVVHFRGETFPVRVLRLPGYLEAHDPQGNLVKDTVMSHADRVRVSPIYGCAFDCTFCDLAGLRYVKRPVDQLLVALEVAKQDTRLPVRHVLISGGTPAPRDYGYFEEVCEAICRAAKMPVDVMMVLHNHLDLINNLTRMGINGFALNMEIYDEATAKGIIRLKHRLGLESFAASIERAVERTGGNGRVRSLMVVGLESLESTLKGLDFLARMGCDPVISPFRPARGIPLANTPPPSTAFLERIYLKALEIADKYRVKIGPRCMEAPGSM